MWSENIEVLNPYEALLEYHSKKHNESNSEKKTGFYYKLKKILFNRGKKYNAC